MALITKEMWDDLYRYGFTITNTQEIFTEQIPLSRFLFLPEPGERSISISIGINRYFTFQKEPYDDGGGACLAFFRYGLCATHPR